MNIVDYANYLEQLRKSHNTIMAYCKDVEMFEKYVITKGLTDLSEVTSTEVVAYLLKLANEGISSSTSSRKLSSLRTYYSFLVEKGLTHENPCIGIKAPRTERKDMEYLSTDDIEKLLSVPDDSIKGLRDRAILEVLYATGIHISELLEMTLDDLNMRMGFVMCNGNHGKARIIPFGKHARGALQDYLKLSRPILVDDMDTQLLFVNINGDSLTRQGLWKILKDYAQKAELSVHITPQTLRNSFAVHMLQNGADLKSLQELMGHEDISTTEAYLTVTKNRIKDVYDRTHPRA